MEAITPELIAGGAVNIVTFPLLLWFIKRYLERFDDKRERARTEQVNADAIAELSELVSSIIGGE